MTHNIPSATFDLPDAVQSINKGDLTRARQFNRRERLNMNGLNREIIGGNYDNTNNASGGASQTYIDPVTGQVMQTPAVLLERGLTYPLNITNLSAEIQPVDLQRKFLFVQNNDPIGRVTVSFGGSAAVLGVGFNLAPAGGGILLDIHCPTARMFMIGSIALNANVVMVVA